MTLWRWNFTDFIVASQSPSKWGALGGLKNHDLQYLYYFQQHLTQQRFNSNKVDPLIWEELSTMNSVRGKAMKSCDEWFACTVFNYFKMYRPSEDAHEKGNVAL